MARLNQNAVSGGDDGSRRPAVVSPSGSGREGQPDAADCAKSASSQLDTMAEACANDLRESQIRYLDLFDATPDGIWVHDPEGVILDANAAMAARLGLSRIALVGRRIQDFIAPDNAATVHHNVRDVIDGRPSVFESTNISSTGTVTEVEVHECGIAWHGQPAVLSISRDITRRKRMEHLLCAERDLAVALASVTGLDETLTVCLETALSGSGMEAGGVYLVDPHSGALELRCHHGLSAAFIDANRRHDAGSPHARIVGEGRPVYARHSRLGVPLAGIDADEGLKATAVIPIRHHARLLGCLNVASFQFDELPEHVQGFLETLADYIGLAIASELAEDEHRRTAQRLKSILGNMLDLVALTDMQGNYRYVGASHAILRNDPEAMVGRNVMDFVHPDDYQRVTSAFQAFLTQTDNDQSPSVEYRYRNADGSYRWFETIGKLIRDDHGAAAEILFNTRDISERKRSEAERLKLQTQLSQAQKLETIGRLAGGVAHDFNNMLQAILGYTEVIMEQVASDPDVTDDLLEIQKAAERSAALTNQLLAFARRQTITPRVVDVNDAVSAMLRMLERLIGENIELMWKPGCDVWPVKVDASQFDQILTNLCANARDAIADVGTIGIETENVTLSQKACAAIADAAPGDYVMLVVADDGCGMDAETLTHVFEPFYTTKEMGKGTGLGLGSVYGAVKQNAGFVVLDSEPGRGTSVRIYLPRHLAMAQDVIDTGSVQAACGHETILLVEDEPTTLGMMTRLLQRLGYTVLSVGSPDDALRLAQANPERIDLLMTDVVMPTMNGRDLANQVMTIIPGVKRLFFSGYTADVIARHGVLDPDIHFIQKPFSKIDLAIKLREVLKI